MLIIVRQRMAILQVMMMFPGLERQAMNQVAVPKQGTIVMATERQVTALEGQVIGQAAVAAPDQAASATTD